MIQQKSKTPLKPRQAKAMSRKEALALLHQLQNAYTKIAIELDVKTQGNTFGTETQRAFRQQVRDALELLATTLHGRRPLGSCGLCEICYLHYETHMAWWHEKNQLYSLIHRRCCSGCYRHLQQEHTLLTEEEVDKELGI